MYMDVPVGVYSHFCNLNLMEMLGKHWLLMCSHVLQCINFNTVSSFFFLSLPVLSSSDSLLWGLKHDLLLAVECSHQNIQVTVVVVWSFNIYAYIVWIRICLCDYCCGGRIYWVLHGFPGLLCAIFVSL